MNKNLANLPEAVGTIATMPQGDGTLWGTLYTTAYPNGIVLNSKADYDALSGGTGSSTNHNFSVNGLSINAGTITKFSFGSACAYTRDSFLTYCTALTSLEHTEVLLDVGDNFLFMCTSFNSPLDLSNVTKIGKSFLYGLRNFNSELKMPKVVEIGTNFMQGCSSFTQQLVFPASLSSIGIAFMYGMDNFVGPLIINTAASSPTDNSTLASGWNDRPAYVQGVTITGIGAPGWRAALPDRNSNPYRKLILA